MTVYEGTTKTQLRQTAREARQRIQDALRLLDENLPLEAEEAATEAAGIAGNFEGEVEAYTRDQARRQME